MARTAKSTPLGPWHNAITHYGEEAPDQLLAYPGNPKIHPRSQQTALEGALSELGWLMPVVVSERSGHVLDGHARIALAISRNEPTVPVAYVDIPPEQEALAIATIDPIGSLAVHDKEALDALLRDVSTGDAALQAFLDGLGQREGVVPPIDPLKEWEGMPEFEQDDKMPHRTLYVHFADDEAVQDFARLIGQALTDKTKYVWHPAQMRQNLVERQYASDEP